MSGERARRDLDGLTTELTWWTGGPDPAPPALEPAASRRSERELTTYLAAMDDALAWLERTATTLERIARDTDLLGTLRASIGAGTTSRDAASQQTEEVGDRLARLANTRHGRRRLFGGTGLRAVERTPDGWEFTGDSRAVMRPIGPGQSVRVNVDGRSVLGFDTSADLLNTTIRLADALRSGDQEGADHAWDDLDERVRDLRTARRAVQARRQRLRAAREVLAGSLHATRATPMVIDQAEPPRPGLDRAQEELCRQALTHAAAAISLPSLRDFLA